MATQAETSASNAVHAELLEIVDCPFCGSASAEYVTGPICDGPSHHFKEPYRSLATRMSRCTKCNVLYQRERLKPEHLGRLYDEDSYLCYKSFAERGLIIRKLAQLSASMLIKEVDRHRPKDNNVLVDFGCGNGSWLELFRACNVNWDLYGTEIGPGNVEHIKRLGFKGYCCDETNIAEFFPPGSVGMIYMHHVIEHVPNPLETFRTLRGPLAPGGLIFGQTPDWRCWERQIFGDHWAQWHQPHHLTIFDKQTMAAHAREAGLEVVSLKSSPSGATQWSNSFLKRRAAKRGRVYRWTGEPLHPFLTLSALPISLLQCLVHNTSHLDFMLRKPL
jgi:trans-aconitate methyltransferase